LAGESTAKNVNWPQGVSCELSDVWVTGNAWPVLSKYPLAELILLAEPRGSEASALESKVEATNAAEEGADNHRPSALSLLPRLVFAISTSPC
jgi:hypothetical protein